MPILGMQLLAVRAAGAVAIGTAKLELVDIELTTVPALFVPVAQPPRGDSSLRVCFGLGHAHSVSNVADRYGGSIHRNGGFAAVFLVAAISASLRAVLGAVLNGRLGS